MLPLSVKYCPTFPYLCTFRRNIAGVNLEISLQNIVIEPDKKRMRVANEFQNSENRYINAASKLPDNAFLFVRIFA